VRASVAMRPRPRLLALATDRAVSLRAHMRQRCRLHWTRVRKLLRTTRLPGDRADLHPRREPRVRRAPLTPFQCASILSAGEFRESSASARTPRCEGEESGLPARSSTTPGRRRLGNRATWGPEARTGTEPR
jgi:hypothetical protein